MTAELIVVIAAYKGNGALKAKIDDDALERHPQHVVATELIIESRPRHRELFEQSTLLFQLFLKGIQP